VLGDALVAEPREVDRLVAAVNDPLGDRAAGRRRVHHPVARESRDDMKVVETTGPGAVNMLAIISGYIVPSADGTFAVRCASEVAVASGLTIKAGSWLRIWETDN